MFIFDETTDLRLQLCHRFGGKLAQNDVRIGVVAGDFREIVVGFVAADSGGGEL